MFTACELCVCATYSAVTGTSLAATATVVTAIGTLAGATLSSLPQPGSAMASAAATSNETAACGDAAGVCLIQASRQSLNATCAYSTRASAGRKSARGILQ